MNTSRREFLKISAASLGAAAFRPILTWGDAYDSGDLARVATYSVSVYKQPDDQSEIVSQRYRDELLHIYNVVESEKGPAYNPIWYRVWRGYIHSGRVQRVQVRNNPLLETIPEGGQVGEISVPYTQSLRYRLKNWDNFSYRLYFESLHWITGVETGPNGEPWYRLHDELLEIDYFVQATHVRPLLPEEFDPLSPDVPAHKKHIEVSISEQSLKAFEEDRLVFQTNISSGIPSWRKPANGISTSTPRGEFRIYSKLPSKHMGYGAITNDLEAYELPGVPWTTFFEQSGVAFHGTYWHNNYGMQMSHGCINMRTEEAHWLYRWTTPVAEPDDWERRGNGTRVIVY